jgi:hypothetical protein
VSLVDLYRDLHQHPELSFQETRTAAIAAERLRAAGFDTTEGVGGTGVVGVLRNGPGPTALLRADMDALPVLEDTGLEYASTARGVDRDGHDVPIAHACGHDVHVSCLVGAADALAAARETWSGTLLAVFQPGEELACSSGWPGSRRTTRRSTRRWSSPRCRSGSRRWSRRPATGYRPAPDRRGNRDSPSRERRLAACWGQRTRRRPRATASRRERTPSLA